jgi:hypothetical protein
MKSLPVYLICFFIAPIITANTYSQDTIIKAIEVRDNNPIWGETFHRVFYMGWYVVYQSQYRADSSVLHPGLDAATNETSFAIDFLSGELRSSFFVFHKDSVFGYTYDPADSSNDNRRLPVDSAMKKIKGENNYENLLSAKPDSSTWNAAKKELREVFVGDSTKTQPRVRIVFYYSGNMNHIKESMSPALDSAKKMKLYKMEIFTDEFYSEADKKLWPPMKVMSTEMKEIGVQNPAEVKGYISRYKKSIGTYN